MLQKVKNRVGRLLSVANLLPVIVILVAVSWAWSTIGVIQRNFQFQRQVDQLRQEVALMELENETLQYKIAYYKTSEYAELAARDNLNKAAPGEKVLVLPSNASNAEENKVPVNDDSQATPVEQQSNFQQWKYFLFRKDKQDN